jgi:hypothetical protein
MIIKQSIKPRVTMDMLELLLGKDMEESANLTVICQVTVGKRQFEIGEDDELYINGHPTGLYVEDAQWCWDNR